MHLPGNASKAVLTGRLPRSGQDCMRVKVLLQITAADGIARDAAKIIGIARGDKGRSPVRGAAPLVFFAGRRAETHQGLYASPRRSIWL